MSAEQLIELIEERQLLSSRLVEKLRAKVESAEPPISAPMLAKFLVKKEHLSSERAAELLEALAAAPVADRKSLHGANAGDSSIFAPTEPARTPRAADEDDAFRLTPVDDDEDDDEEVPVLLGEPESKGSAPVDELPQLDDAAMLPGDLPANDLLAADEGPTKDRRGRPSARKKGGSRRREEVAPSDLSSATGPPPGKAPGLRKKIKKKQQWDSPLILIGGGVLVLLIVCGVVVALMLNRRSGDDKLAAARGRIAMRALFRKRSAPIRNLWRAIRATSRGAAPAWSSPWSGCVRRSNRAAAWKQRSRLRSRNWRRSRMTKTSTNTI